MNRSPRLDPEIRQRARLLRRNATHAESLLWSRLRRRGLQGMKFRRQHPMASFILDFYCMEAKLGIELDGNQHLDSEAARQDAERALILGAQHGVQILRFQNEQVLRDTECVVRIVQAALLERSGSHLPDQEPEWK